MAGGPVAAEINDGDAASGFEIFFQAFQILRLTADVVQSVDDGDQVDGFGQLRIGFGGQNRFDVGQFLLPRRAFDVFKQFGVYVNGVNDAFAAGLPSQRACEESRSGAEVADAVVRFDLERIDDFVYL